MYFEIDLIDSCDVFFIVYQKIIKKLKNMTFMLNKMWFFFVLVNGNKIIKVFMDSYISNKCF